MGRPTIQNSVRHRIKALEVDEATTFPIEKYEYLQTISFKLGKMLSRKYSVNLSGTHEDKSVTVTRTV